MYTRVSQDFMTPRDFMTCGYKYFFNVFTNRDYFNFCLDCCPTALHWHLSYLYMSMHVTIYLSVCLSVCLSLSLCVCVCVWARCMCVYVCLCVCEFDRHTCLYACVCLCVHVCMCVWVHTSCARGCMHPRKHSSVCTRGIAQTKTEKKK